MDHMMQYESTVPSGLAPAEILTLRDVIGMLENAADLSRNRKAQMLSAVRTLCRVLGRDPVDVSADPAVLRAHMETVSPAAAKLTVSRWVNLRSLIVAALNACGFGIMPSRQKESALSPLWAALWDKLPLRDRRLRCGLSRFMNFCTAKAIEPEGVTTATFTTFNVQLMSNSLVRNVADVYRTACVCWNDAARDFPGWPKSQVYVPSTSLCYSLDWDAYPPSFKADVDRYLDKVANQDPFAEDYAKPIAAATQITRRKQIRMLATALTRQGVAPSHVTGIATRVEHENAAKALEFCFNRAGRKKTENVYNLAVLLKTMARHWVKADEKSIRRIEELCGRLATKNTGMTDKNRERLRQFDDLENIIALLNLPARMLTGAEACDDGGSHAAMRVLYAVAVSILTVSAIRLKNLTHLEIDRHIVRQRVGSQSLVHLVIPGDEVKNGVSIERELPQETVDLLNLYLKKYRPRLISAPSVFLFPNASGAARNPTSFSQRIGEIILAETGLKMHVHLFRQTAVKLHLDAHPEDLETARLLLGHKHLRTTMRSYAELKATAAFKRYDGVLAKLAEEGAKPARKSRKAVRS